MKADRSLTWMSSTLAFLVALASSFGVFSPVTYALESGSYSAQGVGQDFFNLTVVVPSLLIFAHRAARGSNVAFEMLGGVILYILYSYTIYAFTLHFNTFFLLYCATLGFSFFGFLVWIHEQHRRLKIIAPCVSHKPSVFVQMAIAFLFSALWLSDIIPALVQSKTPKSILESGVVTNAVQVLDLSIALPAMVLSAYWLHQKRLWGYILTPALLGFSGCMSLAIASMAFVQKIRGYGADFTVCYLMTALSFTVVVVLWRYLRLSKTSKEKNSKL